MPLYRRLPKRGFNNYNHKEIVAIDIAVLERFEDGATVDVQALKEMGIIKESLDGVKIIGNADLSKKLNVKVDAYSAGAKAKIEAAGGTAEVAE
ncbi:MAG TPA: 50S ribosomal protein L15, partial [Lachnospiraceae bacterium]|nr:50S ribosomal protein L15 [Lachnospiraceae bacterium]